MFKHPEGAAHKAIRQALGGAYFSFHNSQRLQGKMVLGEDSYGHSGDKYFWPLSYSSAKTAQKRMDKLEKAGIRCKLTGYNGGCIEFLGYTPETEALLEKDLVWFLVGSNSQYEVEVCAEVVGHRIAVIEVVRHYKVEDILHHLFGSVGKRLVSINVIVIYIVVEHYALILLECLEVCFDKVDMDRVIVMP